MFYHSPLCVYVCAVLVYRLSVAILFDRCKKKRTHTHNHIPNSLITSILCITCCARSKWTNTTYSVLVHVCVRVSWSLAHIQMHLKQHMCLKITSSLENAIIAHCPHYSSPRVIRFHEQVFHIRSISVSIGTSMGLALPLATHASPLAKVSVIAEDTMLLLRFLCIPAESRRRFKNRVGCILEKWQGVESSKLH